MPRDTHAPASAPPPGRTSASTVKPWFRLEEQAVIEALATSEDGLVPEEAARRLTAHGPNALAAKREKAALAVFLDQFKSPLIYILLAAAAVAQVMGKGFDVWVILGIVAINAVLGFVMERRAAGAIAALRKLTSAQARVVRAGNVLDLPASDVVAGDVLLLEPGDRVAADARIIRASELSIGEAELTGESVPSPKSSAPIPGEEALPLGDRANMAFMNTAVVAGRGRAIVVATGMDTEIGKIARDVAESETETPAQRRLSEFGHKLGLVLLSVIAFVVGAGLLLGHPPGEMIYVALSLAVATIPEGLPIVVSVLFAIGVTRMAKERAFVRRLPAVEGLGSATVIGSDKTGTLTRNEMTVERVFLGDRTLEVKGQGYAPEGRVLREGAPVAAAELPGLCWLGRAASLCNDAIVERQEGAWRVLGDPTEGALLVLARRAGAVEDWERVQEIPFSSERKWMATLNRAPDGELVAFAKGALERLLPMARAWMDVEGRVRPMTDADRDRFERAAEEMATGALRVLAIGLVRQVPHPEAFSGDMLAGGLVLAGLAGMMDPARPEAVAAIRTCQEAGIHVVMITGDHRATAVAIAERLGLVTPDQPSRTIDGVALEAMSDAELRDRAGEISVYARVSPEHKLRIVRALQARGAIAAMTGDGVNDAPALSQADVGIAMGITGTEVAKGASDMVLADDNFATIVSAVRQGRTISENLRKVIHYLVTTSFANMLTIAIGIFAGLPLPLLPAQLLWINMVTDGMFDKTLALEKGEPDLMRRPPRAPSSPILSRDALWRVAYLGGFMAVGTIAAYAWELSQGASEIHARTEAFVTLAAFQWFSAFAYRSKTRSVLGLPPNYWMLGALGLATLAQLAAVYWPPLQRILGTEALSPFEFALAVLIASSLLVVSEIIKVAKRRLARRR